MNTSKVIAQDDARIGVLAWICATSFSSHLLNSKIHNDDDERDDNDVNNVALQRVCTLLNRPNANKQKPAEKRVTYHKSQMMTLIIIIEKEHHSPVS